MRNTISKATVAGLAALSLTVSLVATTDPASAQRWHGGGGGWHGGGGWRGGYGGWRGGYGGWRGGYGGYGGWWGPAVVAGLAAGAIAGGYYGYGYGNGCWIYQPVYDGYGNYIGRQLVNVCY